MELVVAQSLTQPFAEVNKVFKSAVGAALEQLIAYLLISMGQIFFAC